MAGSQPTQSHVQTGTGSSCARYCSFHHQSKRGKKCIPEPQSVTKYFYLNFRCFAVQTRHNTVAPNSASLTNVTIGVHHGSSELYISATQLLTFFDPVYQRMSSDDLFLKGEFSKGGFSLTGTFIGTCYAPGVCLNGGTVYVHAESMSRDEYDFYMEQGNGTDSWVKTHKMSSSCDLVINILGTEIHKTTAWPVGDFSVPLDRLHITQGLIFSGE